MKVISFKVNDDIYFALKSKKQTFRSIFEPLAIQLSQNNRKEMKYTGSIPTNYSDLYQDIQLVLKKYENEVKK